MLDILSITFPIFAVIAIGYGAVRVGVFQPADMKPLGKFVLDIALPALLFTAVATRPASEILNWGYLAAYAGGGLATIAVMLIWLRLTGVGPARRAIGAMGASCPNSGFVGYPVMLLLFPDLAGVVLALNFLAENVLLIPLNLLLLEMSRDRASKSVPKLIGALMLALLKRPMVIGLALGFAVSLSGVAVPDTALRLLDILAGAAIAVSLFVIGGSLVGLPMQGNRMLAGQIALGKLVLHPALTFAALAALPMIGLSLTPQMATALILSAAMPMFGIFTVIAQDYGHEGLASLAMLATTASAFITLTVLIAWLV